MKYRKTGMGQVCGVMVIGMLLSGVSGPAWADDSSNAALKADIEILKQRLSELETTLAEQDVLPPTSGDASVATLWLPSGLQGVQFGGYVDTSYTYNFNEPNNRTSFLRAFDTRAEDFMINQAKIFVAKPVSAESPVGFRTDLIFGSDAEVLGSVSTGLGSTTDELDIQQGYVEYLAPLGNGLDVKMGKFTTLHGAEVTESKDNWNFSRSFLFAWAEPLSHTGVRVSYQWDETFTTMFGVNNGWDVVDDNNKAKTVEMGLTWAPLQDVSLSSAYMFGAEQGSDSHDQRHLWTAVASYKPLEKLALKFAYDYGREEDAVNEEGGGSASWQGFAIYAKYDATDRWAIANRFEVFQDQDGVRTAVNSATTSPTGSAIDDLDLWEWTLTNEYKINSHLIARLEYRLDKADSKVFRHDQGFSNYQNTVALEVIAPF